MNGAVQPVETRTSGHSARSWYQAALDTDLMPPSKLPQQTTRLTPMTTETYASFTASSGFSTSRPDFSESSYGGRRPPVQDKAADDVGVRPRLRDLPRATIVLALALARGNRFEAFDAAQLARGLAIQISLRWWLGQVLIVPGRAVLLYSELDHRRGARRMFRTVLGVGFAVSVGLVLFAVNKVILLLPVAPLIFFLGGDTNDVFFVLVGFSVLRLTWTASRAITAYRLEHRRAAAMAPIGGAPRWRLELMGANPPRSGHGLVLLKALMLKSDAAGATVYLICEPVNRDFYRRAGFRVVPADGKHFTGMLLMRRIAPARIPVRHEQAKLARARQLMVSTSRTGA